MKDSRLLPALFAVLSATVCCVFAEFGSATAHFSMMQTAATDQLVHLLPDQQKTSTIRSSQTKLFTFELAQDQYADLTVTWPKLDLEVVISNPDRTPLLPAAITIRGSGDFPISVLAKQSGKFSVEVRAVEQSTFPGDFDIKLTNVRLAGDSDRKRFRAQELLLAGNKERSIASYQESLKLWREVDDTLGQAYTLQQLGPLYLSSKKVTEAEACYAELLKLRESDPRSLMYTLRDIGSAQRSFGSLETAADYIKRAFEIARVLKDRPAEASLLYSLGLTEARGTHTTVALEHYEQARKIQRENGDLLSEARTLNAMGGAHNLRGDQDKAMTFYRQAIPIFEQLQDRYREAIMNNNVGVAEDDLGHWQEAKTYYASARSTLLSLLNNDLNSCRTGAPAQTLTYCSTLADTIDNVGELFNSTGDPDAALDEFAISIPIRNAVNNNSRLGMTLSRICYSYVLKGKSADAIPKCEEAITRSETAKDWLTWAQAQLFLGMAQAAANNPTEAFKRYEQALRRHQEGNLRRAEGNVLNQLGLLYAATGRPQESLEKFSEALKVWRSTRDEDGETITLFNIAKVERDRGNYAAAHEQVQQAIRIVEGRRSTLNSQRLAASYFANKQDYYELAIDVLMNLARGANSEAFIAQALETSEHAHGRRLTDALAEARLINTTDAQSITARDPVLKSLVDQQNALGQRLSATATSRTVMLTQKHPAEEAQALAKEIEKLTAEYDEVEGKIKTLHLTYASLVKPKPLAAKAIQQQLDTETLLVEYALGEKRSYVWVVSRDSINAFPLPPRKEIEELAARVTESLKFGGEKTGPVEKDRRLAEYIEVSTSLSRLVLQPIAGLLTKKRVAIVADGALQYVSFAALPNPRATASELYGGLTVSAAPAPGRLLLEDFEIVRLPSASVLAEQRKLIEGRQPAPSLIAVFADPVYSAQDFRVQNSEQSEARNKTRRRTPAAPLKTDDVSGTRSPLSNALNESGIETLAPLVFSRAEAKSIIAAAKGQGKVFLDFDASRATVTAPDLSHYKIIHFATHGILNLKNPQVSGLVLSMVDEHGQPQNGYLQLHEIYKLKLPAELVVLSGCHTGTGKEIRGEGLMALTRAFMYAGASRLIASLWKVDDSATSQLMARFYKEMLTNNKRPSAALREAQLELARERRWKSPYYWAAFELQGEWK